MIGAVLFLRSLHALLRMEPASRGGTSSSRRLTCRRIVRTSTRRLLEEAAPARRRGRPWPTRGRSGPTPGGTSTSRATRPGQRAENLPWVGLVSRRLLQDDDGAAAPRARLRRSRPESRPMVMIVNETFARHYFGGENPVGRRVGLAQRARHRDRRGRKRHQIHRASGRSHPHGLRPVSARPVGAR